MTYLPALQNQAAAFALRSASATRDSTNSTNRDLSIPIRGDFEEGYQIYGENGSVQGKVYLPWFHKASEIECFSTKDGLYRRPLGEDAFTYKRQIEGWADTILNSAPQHGATLDDGIAAMRALVAISRSVSEGRQIKLAEVTGAV